MRKFPGGFCLKLLQNYPGLHESLGRSGEVDNSDPHLWFFQGFFSCSGFEGSIKTCNSHVPGSSPSSGFIQRFFRRGKRREQGPGTTVHPLFAARKHKVISPNLQRIWENLVHLCFPICIHKEMDAHGLFHLLQKDWENFSHSCLEQSLLISTGPSKNCQELLTDLVTQFTHKL